MKLVGYVRVSTEKQADEGQGLAVQEKQIRSWAREHGHRLVALCSDEGVSGSNGIEHRVGLPDALHLIEIGDVKGIIVAKLDRLARDLLVQETTIAQVWRVGASVFAVDQGEVLRDDPDDPMRTAFRQIVGVFSQLERAMIAARLRAGRLHKAEQGGYAGGRPPFGYRAEGRELVPNPNEQATIESMRQWRRQGASLRQISVRLDAEGYKTRTGGPWHPFSVRRVLEARRAE